MFSVFLRLAQTGGDVVAQPYFFRPSVVVQQLCSYVKQNRLGEIDPETAYQLFASPAGVPLISKTLYDLIIEHLLAKQYFTASDRNVLKPGAAWQELFEQRGIYTNLMDVSRKTIEVIEEETGRRLGEIERSISPGEAMLFGGHARQASRMIGRKLMVRAADAEATTQVPRLRAAWRPMSPALAQAVASELGVPRAADSSAMAMMIESEEDEVEGEEKNELPSLTTTLFHCAGDAWGMVLGDLLETLYRVRATDHGELYVNVKGALPAAPLEFTAEQVRINLRRRWKQLESWFDLGRFQAQLPLDVRRAGVVEAFDVAGFVQAFNGREIAEAVESAPRPAGSE